MFWQKYGKKENKIKHDPTVVMWKVCHTQSLFLSVCQSSSVNTCTVQCSWNLRGECREIRGKVAFPDSPLYSALISNSIVKWYAGIRPAPLLVPESDPFWVAYIPIQGKFLTFCCFQSNFQSYFELTTHRKEKCGSETPFRTKLAARGSCFCISLYSLCILEKKGRQTLPFKTFAFFVD